jgi:hypothetical protein
MAEYIPTPPAAGWYPDPSGQPGQRYHDGQRWTTHFTPNPPAAGQPSVVVNNHVGYSAPSVAVAVSGGVNHGLHLLLTVVTCGAWLPIWIIVAIFGGSRATAISSGPGGIAVSGDRSKIALAVGGVFVGLFLLGLIAQHPWLLAIFVPAALAGGGFFYTNRQKQIRDAENQKMSVRAEYENDLHAEGDPRGTHGRYLPPEEFR